MRIDIFCLFPNMFDGPFSESMLKRARERGLVDIVVHDIRAFSHNTHHTTDDYPYGGGAGMVMKPEPVFEAVESLKKDLNLTGTPIILLTPQGRLFNQNIARELSQHNQLVFICGHYEGIDERVSEFLATDHISIGDYILTSGETAAAVVVDTVVRLLPGVLGSEVSLLDESHSSGLLEYPQYTRPAEYRQWVVPPVLLSGDHGKIARWRRKQSLLRTLKRRPDLLEKAALSDEDKHLLEMLKRQDNLQDT
ncbi:MAG: tRNA (guanosine(37)-N1)-methyltransferase TrmD [Chloroflexota bacterium]